MTRLVERLYDHWSFLILCIYCFVGLLASMFYGMRAFSPSMAEPYDFIIAIILFITSLIAGTYCKIVDDSCSGFAVRSYIDSVPDERKDMAKSLFPKRYWK